MVQLERGSLMPFNTPSVSGASQCPKCKLPRFTGATGYALPQCTCEARYADTVGTLPVSHPTPGTQHVATLNPATMEVKFNPHYTGALDTTGEPVKLYTKDDVIALSLELLKGEAYSPRLTPVAQVTSNWPEAFTSARSEDYQYQRGWNAALQEAKRTVTVAPLLVPPLSEVQLRTHLIPFFKQAGTVRVDWPSVYAQARIVEGLVSNHWSSLLPKESR